MSVPPHFLVPIHDGHSTQTTNISLSPLPFELVEALNQTYFLHLLVTQPEKVVPPGKSLLSMMTHANYEVPEEDEKDTAGRKDAKVKHLAIEKKVREVAHKAFWNEALEHLSSPLPSVQLPRLQQLYLDLNEALAPLLPPAHHILASLTHPFPPTSSPLHSTIILLKEIVAALRERCAPIRDEAVDTLAASLENLPPGSAGSHSELAQFVLDSMKKILDLAEDMRRDLNTFVLGAMTETQLKSVLARDVKNRERNLVIQLWGGQDNVRQAWREWIAQLAEAGEGETKWVKRLLSVLGSDKPVYSQLPNITTTSEASASTQTQASSIIHPQSQVDMNMKSPDSGNHEQLEPPLPPQLLFFTPTLLYIQNYVQAIVIAGALRALTRLAVSPTSTSDFTQRVWTLLETEIEGDVPGARYPQATDSSEQSHIRLVNLADEVLRARQLVSGSSLKPEEESQLRATVERTLRANDPVFLLLRRRLLKALEERAVASIKGTEAAPNINPSIPIKMQTGKDPMAERAGKRMRLMLPEYTEPIPRINGAKLEGLSLPGFEDPVLQRVIEEVVGKILDIVVWTGEIWGDLV